MYYAIVIKMDAKHILSTMVMKFIINKKVDVVMNVLIFYQVA